jgi:hypothetical protein
MAHSPAGRTGPRAGVPRMLGGEGHRMSGDVPTDVLEPAVDLDLAAIDPMWYAVAAGVLLLLIALIVFALVRRRRRRQQYEDRYGAEYQRTVERAGSRRAADKELHDREERRQQFELRRLDHDERDRFRARWEDLQASFVDGPAAAVRSADELLDDVAAKVGYPKAGRDQRLADLSVDHPATVEEYRRGRPTSADAERGPTTEQLRQALLTSRSLFEALVGRDTEDIGLPPAPFRDLEESDQVGRTTERPHTGEGTVPADGTPATDAEDRSPRETSTAPQEIVVRDHEPATSRTAAPAYDRNGRRINDDGR